MRSQIIKTSCIRNLILGMLLFFVFCLPLFVSAQTKPEQDYKLLAPIPGFGDTGDIYKPGDIGKYVSSMVTLAIVISAVLAVVMITIGGFKYMTSESMSLKEDGKKNIQNAFLGLLIWSASYLILNTINPALLDFNLNIRKVQVGSNPNSGTQTSKEVTNNEIKQSIQDKGIGTGFDPNQQYKLVEPSGTSTV